MPGNMGVGLTPEQGRSGTPASNGSTSSAVNHSHQEATANQIGQLMSNGTGSTIAASSPEGLSLADPVVRDNPPISISNPYDVLCVDESSDEESSSEQRSIQPLRSDLQATQVRTETAEQAVSANRAAPDKAYEDASTLPAPDLSPKSQGWLGLYNLRLACGYCFNGCRYRKCEHPCRGTFLLCRQSRSSGTGNEVWGIIRERTRPEYSGPYKLCTRSPTKSCCRREDCYYCHSKEEKEIWHQERAGNFNRTEISDYLCCVQKIGQSEQDNDGFSVVTKPKSKKGYQKTRDNRHYRPGNGSQRSGPPTGKHISGNPNSPMLISDSDRKAYRSLMCNVGGHFLYLCEKCFDSAPPVMFEKSSEGPCCANAEKKHPWPRSKVLVHLLSDGEHQRYLKVRQRPSHLTIDPARLCWDVDKKFGCQRGDSCGFAHNEVEIAVWQCEATYNISQDAIVQLCTEAFIPEFKHRLKYIEPDSHEVVLYSERRSTWCLVQERYSKLRPETPLIMCRHGMECRKDQCKFPHCQEEVDLWTYMAEHNLRTLDQVISVAAVAASRPSASNESSATPQPLVSKPHIEQYCCTYCDLHFPGVTQLQNHLKTVRHRSRVNSDKEKEWKYRAPPWNVVDGRYEICLEAKGGSCSLGETSCTKAHSFKELEEWKERHRYRMTKIKTAKDQKLYDYMDELLSMHKAGMNVFQDEMPGVSVTCSENLSTSLKLTKRETGAAAFSFTWKFVIKTTKKKHLKQVGLLLPDHHTNFSLAHPKDNAKVQVCPGNILADGNRYQVSVVFKSEIIGTFSQWVVFYFGTEPVLVRKLKVDIGSGDQQMPSVQDTIQSETWDSTNSHIVKFTESAGTNNITKAEEELNERLRRQYAMPASLRSKDNNITSEELNRNNYRKVMHRMLSMEEKECNRRISRFTTASSLRVSREVELSDGTYYATGGHMFASINLQQALVDDSLTSQIVVRSVQNVLLKFGSTSKLVYEAAILPNQTFGNGSQDVVLIKLSSQCVVDQQLTDGAACEVTVQLQLDRTQFCYKHFAIDQLQNLDMVLPPASKVQKLDSYLPETASNPRQEQIIRFISTHGGKKAPPMPGVGPVLLCGPFGTGKTFTLATAAKRTLTTRPTSRILICTHSNSAADWYITNYLHDFVDKREAGYEVNMMRIYATYRRLNTVDPKVRSYVLTDEKGNIRLPDEETIRKSHVVVTTLTTAVNLVSDSLRGHFTHILIDEAGQVLEAEALMPLALATEDTCVVLTGDHNQMSPRVFSEAVSKAGFNKSLLERLFLTEVCNVFLTFNYRTCQPILDFISPTYYKMDEPFRDVVNQPPHPVLYPLVFYVVKGVDQHVGKSYVNTHEVLEVVRRVKELHREWPKKWGPFNESDIGVISPCIMQVHQIRKSLRNEGLGRVIVETVDNVQGKQFRAVIISTVRTRNTMQRCYSATKGHKNGQDKEFYCGFLSDSKLINTAFTRTQSLLVVVGDPTALCSLGRCSTKWKNYLQKCEQNNSLFPLGTTLEVIHAEVRAANQTLNPNAEPFRPANRHTSQTTAKSQAPHQRQESNVSDKKNTTLPAPHDNDSHSDMDSGCTDDDDSDIDYSDIEDDMLNELRRQVEADKDELRTAEHVLNLAKEETRKLEVDGSAKKAENSVQDQKGPSENIAEVANQQKRPDEEAPLQAPNEDTKTDSIAKVVIAKVANGQRAPGNKVGPKSIAKVTNQQGAPDNEVEPESIAKVAIHQGAPNNEVGPESIAKVANQQGAADNEAEPESIAKVANQQGVPNNEVGPESIAKVANQQGAPDNEAEPESIAKVANQQGVPNNEVGPESIAKVANQQGAPDNEAEPESIAKVANQQGVPNNEVGPESIAKVANQQGAPDNEAEPESIAKVANQQGAPNNEVGPESIAKVGNQQGAPDNEAEPESIAKVGNQQGAPNNEAEPESIAKVANQQGAADNEVEPESIAKVANHQGAPKNEAEPESIAKVANQHGAPNNEVGPESIAKVANQHGASKNEVGPESIAKVANQQGAAPNAEATRDSFAEVATHQSKELNAETTHLQDNTVWPNATQPLMHLEAGVPESTIQEGASYKEMVHGQQVATVTTPQSHAAKIGNSANLSEILMKPRGKSSRTHDRDLRNIKMVPAGGQILLIQDTYDRSNLVGADDFEEDIPEQEEQEEDLRMMDEELRLEGLRLVQSEPEKFKICSFRFETSGFTFAVPKGKNSSQQIWISGKKRRGQALHLDEVVVEILQSNDEVENDGACTERKIYGKVICILKRSTNPYLMDIVCTLDKYTDNLMVPINRTFPKLYVFSRKGKKKGQKTKGHVSADFIPVSIFERRKGTTKGFGFKETVKVSRKDRQNKLFVVRYWKWYEKNRYPMGFVTEELRPGNNREDGLLILKHTHGVRDEFKPSVVRDIKMNFPPGWKIPDEVIQSRKDLRQEVIFTVDHPETQELDDALSIEFKNGKYHVGIHIADVANYVPKGSTLDEQAKQRAVSFYPAFSEPIHMLPSRLTTNLCSLLPSQDRLAISVFVTMDDSGSITRVEFDRSVIRSQKRLTYMKVEEMIQSPKHGCKGAFEEKVSLLNQLAQKRRRSRLMDGCLAYSHDSGEEELRHPLASSMVEEMMLIANEEVAKFLLNRNPELTPLRSQLPPSQEKVSTWLDDHKQDIPNSLFLQSATALEGEGVHTNADHDVHILNSKMTKLMDVANSPDDASRRMKTTDILCSDENFPELAVAHTQFTRIQERATYISPGDQQDGQKREHHSLKKSCYTHFTSPIRRYIDIVVQRSLIATLTAVQSRSAQAELPYSAEELSLICHHCTNQGIRANEFERETANFHFALKLQEAPQPLQAFVDSTDGTQLQLLYPYRNFIPRPTQRVPLHHLEPAEKPTSPDGRKVNLRWKQRIYDVDAVPEVSAVRATSMLDTEQFVTKFTAVDMQNLLKGVKQEDIRSIQQILHKIAKRKKQSEGDRTQHRLTKGSTLPVTDISAEVLDSHRNHSIFAEFSRDFKESDVLQVHLCASLTKGLVTPSIQLLNLTQKHAICLGHRAAATESFDVVASKRVVRCHNVQKYQDVWLPVIEMMSVHNAVHDNDSIFIQGIKINWSCVESTEASSGQQYHGMFNLTARFCRERHIRLNITSKKDDKDESGDAEENSEPEASLDYLCIHYTDMAVPVETKAVLSQLDYKLRGAQEHSHPEGMTIVLHAAVTEITRYKDIQTVHLVVKKLESPFPQILLDSGKRFPCTVEVIPKLQQDRRLENAVRNLATAPKLIKDICLRTVCQEQMNTSEIDTSFMTEATPLGQPNESQKAALSVACQRPFTVIQGPPGTGKTIVGAMLASHFAEKNKLKLPSGNSPPQVLYCGPSNESVNVVAGYLKKFRDLRVVRVYSETMEQGVYPIPGELGTVLRNKTSQENKMDPRLDSIALHNLIRKPSNPHSEKIKSYDDIFKNKNNKISLGDIIAYRREIAMAEEEELRKYQIILCTCNTSGSRRIKKNVNVVQCIIDEAGMCSEPETLIPLEGTRPCQVVLIGDHKQLRPIITEKTAAELGMEISLLEKYEEKAIMLTTQYRMHESICQFPSRAFYKGRLETDASVKQRQEEPAVLGIWPGGPEFRNVFCHVQGSEETLTVKSAEGNEMSKANLQEVQQVVRIVSTLVNHYNIKPGRILVMSQYRLQCAKIREELAQFSELKKITVSTVITSQGGERDFVVLSTVRSLPRIEIEEKPTLGWKQGNLGFILDENQMNVALTRAKRGLIIIGNQHLLQVHDKWHDLLAQYRQHGAVLHASSFLRRFRPEKTPDN